MADRIVVSNTTPLIALAWLNHLDLMPTLFGNLYIPQAVNDEIQHNPTAVGAAELAPFISVNSFIRTYYSKLASKACPG
jgi:predicted nucleic acid-binding protein